MGDELDPYGLLERAYDETVGEHIEDISPPNSPENEGSDANAQNDRPSFPQRSFIAHKEMKNLDFETNEDNGEEDEEHEKLQFDFDVPSPAFEAISDEEDVTETNAGKSESGLARLETPLNTANVDLTSSHKHELESGSLSPESKSREGIGDDEEDKSRSSLSSEEVSNTGASQAENTTSPWRQKLSNLEHDTDKGLSSDTAFNNELDREENVSRPVAISPISEDSSDVVNSFNKDDDEEKSAMAFNSEDFMFKETEEAAEEPDEGHDVEAPVPSPFSDIGDISGPDTAIISDILKETEHGIPGLESEDHLQLDEPQIGQDNKEKEENLVSLQQENVEVEKPEETTEGDQGTTEDTTAEDEDGGRDVGGLIADIFGESDEEEEEFEGFGEDELYPEKAKASEKPWSKGLISDDEDEDGGNESLQAGEGTELQRLVPDEESSDEEIDDLKPQKEEMISDFDLMMQRKKEMNKSKRRGRRDFDIINDNDDIIAAMIKQMKDAAEEDRLLNQAGQAATKKLKMLPSVIAHLRKADLQHTFIDCGILPVMKEWLSPLPDNSLPHIQIRSSFLRALLEFPPLDKGALKLSGVGRSVMLLFKHPKECRPNKKMAGKIIAEWARPIFGVTTKFTELSREDREERDKMNVPMAKKRRLSSVDAESGTSRPIDQALNEDKKARRPGDKGFVGRARVPMPSNRDYVVRPKSNVEMFDMGRGQKKAVTRFDQQYRKYKDRLGTLGKAGDRAVGISLNGSKMNL